MNKKLPSKFFFMEKNFLYQKFFFVLNVIPVVKLIMPS